MNLGIKGKRALITGAGRGIGEGIAIALASEGVKIIAVSKGEKNLKLLLKKIGGNKNGHQMIASDLTKEEEPQRVYREATKEYGSIDILVNNLGDTLDIKDPFCKLSDWRKLYRLNLEVAIELTNLTVGQMKKKKWGRIVNISSIAAWENQGPVPYCTFKAALNAYTRSMGRILAPEGIVMCDVLPGAVKTKGGYWDKASKESPAHVKKYLEERMAIKRFGEVSEIANFVTFLCSTHSSFVVGSSFLVDGGQGRTFNF